MHHRQTRLCAVIWHAWTFLTSARLCLLQVIYHQYAVPLFLCLSGDDLINPVKMSVQPYVRTSICTSTIKHNAATNHIVVFVTVDETFTTIWHTRSPEVMVKIMWDLKFQKWWFSNSISSAIFQPVKKIPTVSNTRPKYLKISWAGFLNFLLVFESCDIKLCQKIDVVWS